MPIPVPSQDAIMEVIAETDRRLSRGVPQVGIKGGSGGTPWDGQHCQTCGKVAQLFKVGFFLRCAECAAKVRKALEQAARTDLDTPATPPQVAEPVVQCRIPRFVTLE